MALEIASKNKKFFLLSEYTLVSQLIVKKCQGILLETKEHL